MLSLLWRRENARERSDTAEKEQKKGRMTMTLGGFIVTRRGGGAGGRPFCV